jgi:DNA adenine methylase
LSAQTKLTFLRYPGGKQRQLPLFIQLLRQAIVNTNHYIEPFVGGGSVFFHLHPEKANLSDKNRELIDLYKGIRDYPDQIWSIYKNYPSSKRGYYKIRETDPEDLDLQTRAARTLFLNRTCFKGMWRHNADGKFNVGYGGQDRRWSISEQNIQEVSNRLQHANLACCDFELMIKKSRKCDLIFLDPPYRPGEREEYNDHYIFGLFTFDDQQRLAKALARASKRRVNWVMTNSSHPDILELYQNCDHFSLERGTGRTIGHLVKNSGEAVIHNFSEVRV